MGLRQEALLQLVEFFVGCRSPFEGKRSLFFGMRFHDMA